MIYVHSTYSSYYLQVLEKHEKEVENVKAYFEQNREIIESLKIRFLMWEELERLEEMANHKDR